jgi:phosphoglycerate kinase
MKLLVQDLPVKGKKVLVRVDFNVPLNKDGSIADDTRIREALPTIQYLLDQGAIVILMGHLGRPKSKQDIQFSLGIVAKRLSQLIAAPVLFAPDCIGKDVEKMVGELKSGQVLLLENLRFYPAEEDPLSDPSFAKQLSQLADFYVNDAFGSAHRNHSSTATIAQFFPTRAALGLLMQKEIKFLDPLVTNPAHPFFACIGGAKIPTKIGMLKALVSKVDEFFIGGGMAFTFLKAQGIEIGDSIFDEKYLSIAKQFLKECPSRKIHLPIDVVIADKDKSNIKTILIKEQIPKGWQGLDIGPQTIEAWKKDLPRAATIFWNGPMGFFELPPFARGTEELAKTIASLQATTIVGGGDSIAAIQALGLISKFSHVSTGGAASLEYLEYGHLPGIDSASEKI